MKRTKLWWAGLTAGERRELRDIECSSSYSRSSRSNLNRRAELIAKADNAVMEKEKQNENPGV